VEIAICDPFLRYDTGHGSAFQMPASDSAMVRSLENLPEPATFRTLRQNIPHRASEGLETLSWPGGGQLNDVVE
jgi:hypothetical protein